MKRSTGSKMGKFLLGFLGWFLYANIELAIWIGGSLGNDAALYSAIWIPTVAMAIAFIVRKMKWPGIGLASAVLVNTAIWVIGEGSLLRYGLEYLLLPWPLAIGVLILN
jgi:hypothetical protein